MILGLTKTMHTRIIGQRRVKGDAQQHKADGFTYSFMTNITRNDLDWDEIESVCYKCFSDVFHSTTQIFVKDIEISLDIPSGLYSFRFNTPYELTEDAYAAVIRWTIQAYDGSDCFVSDGKPVGYLQNNRYLVEIELESLTLGEVEQLIEDESYEYKSDY